MLGGGAETAALGGTACGVDTLGGTWEPALCGASNGVVLCACCNPPE